MLSTMKKTRRSDIQLAQLVLVFFTLSYCLSSFGQEIKVEASEYPFSTGVKVEKGATYEIVANGEWQDADFPATNANGFKGFTAPMFFGMLLKPLPGQYYMKLCGKVGNWKFPIGTSTTITMKRSGELELFANDAKGFFDNNSGQMVVTLTLVSERDD